MIPHNDILVMLGDFNARVGVLDTGNNLMARCYREAWLE